LDTLRRVRHAFCSREGQDFITKERIMGRGGIGGAVALLALAVWAGGAEAQRRDGGNRAPAGYVGFALLGADPIGELGSHIDAGIGGQLMASLPVEPTGHLRLRGDFGFVIYGHERQRFCYGVPVGCRIEMDLNTTNSILFGGLGPELVFLTGAVEPYMNATFGFSYFATTSSLQGEHDYDDFGSTTNFDDAVFAWRAGGGVRVRVAGGRRPVSLDLGVERHENGVAEFLTEGDIQDNPDGSITLYPRRSQADLTTVRLGVSIGIPHPGDRSDRRDDRRRRGR
jgi:hypothetical protein